MTSTEIVNWEEKLKNESKELAKTERPQTGKISLRGGIMTLHDREIKDNTLLCIVADYIHENMYFKDAYIPDVVKAPDCYSYSINGENMVPHPDIKEPQNPTCTGCWADQFKSAGNGRKGKACGVGRRKLAVLPFYDNVEDFKKSEMAIISLPYMSVQNWSNHVNLLASTPTIQRPPYGVVTKISVKPDPKSQFRVHFEFVTNLSDDFLHAVSEKIGVARNILLTPYDLTPGAYDKPAPEPEVAGKKKKF